MADFTLKYDGTDNELIGEDANNNQIPVPFDAVETDKSLTVSEGEATDTLHYGSNQDRGNAGNQSVAIGIGARAPGDDGSGGSIGEHVAVGYRAARSNTGNRVTAAGHQAAENNTSGNITAVGFRAAENNTGNGVTASGFRAAQNNTGFGVTASGFAAAESNTGGSVTASGFAAAESNTGGSVTASGRGAARDNTGGSVTASGYRAALNNTGGSVTVTGHQAARGDGLSDPTTMGDDNIGVGASAIRNNQASGLIAIGQDAGINAQTDDQLIITQRDGTRRMVMDLTTGDLSITGTLTENATL